MRRKCPARTVQESSPAGWIPGGDFVRGWSASSSLRHAGELGFLFLEAARKVIKGLFARRNPVLLEFICPHCQIDPRLLESVERRTRPVEVFFNCQARF